MRPLPDSPLIMQSPILFLVGMLGVQIKSELRSLFQVSAEREQGNYLGLPAFIGRKKKPVFNFVRVKVWHKNYRGGKIKNCPGLVKRSY